MGNSSQCQKIIQTYYTPIYRYCYASLAYDAVAAEDCTQEVFLVFIQKQHTLDLTTAILPWLYTTAKIVVNNYCKKNPSHDDLQDAEKVEDPACRARLQCAVLRSYLTEEEYRLLYDYYNTGYADHSAVARQYGLQISQLYEKVRYIKRKLKHFSPAKNQSASKNKNGGDENGK